MTSETWLKEFYPIKAYECSAEDALEHSYRKWIGLREEHLEKYGLFLDDFGMLRTKENDYVLTIDGDSCALCKNSNDNCSNCDLRIFHGVSCHQGENSPWRLFKDYHEIESMIQFIKSTIDGKK